MKDGGGPKLPRNTFALILEDSPDSVVIFNRRHEILWANSAAARLFGNTKRELLRKKIEELLPELFEKEAHTERNILPEASSRVEVTGFRKNSSTFWAEVTLSKVLSEAEQLGVASIRDITKQRLPASHLLQNENLFRLILESIEEYAIFALDPQGYVVSWNAGTERVKQYRPEEIVGEHFSLFYTEDDRLANKPARSLAVAAEQGRYTAEGWLVRKDGSLFWASMVIVPIRDGNGKLLGFAKITHDLTERKEAEEKLKLSEDKFSKAFLSSPLPVTISTFKEGLYLEVNDAFLHLIGRPREQVIGYTSQELGIWATPADRMKLIEKFKGTESAKALITFFHNVSGEERRVKISAELIRLDGIPCLLAVSEDVTESSRLEDQSRQLQKLEAIGRLAGGIAHDFNNVLNVILGYCQLLLNRSATEHPYQTQIAKIANAATRATDLTRQLLAFGRQQVLQTKVINLNRIIQDTRDMVERLIGEDIEVSISLGEPQCAIDADPTQIVQVILNLAANARDAMPEGGKLTIETGKLRLDSEYAKTHLGMPMGEYVQLVVTDTGAGMDEATKARIFEPFFTTKQLGQGTGLGLATVYGIVKQSGGFIWVYSEPKQGTAFKIYLPCSSAGVAEENASTPSVEELRGDETVLVVEDSEDLREVAVDFLRSAGFKALDAGDPEQALDIARAHETPIDLLLSDVVLPKMSGRILADKLRQSHPGVRVLFVSGYTDDVIVRHGILNEEVNFLQKPYSQEGLISKIRRVLDHPRD